MIVTLTLNPSLDRTLELDGLQRGNALLLIGLFAVGFGRSSAVLDAGLVDNARLGVAVLCVAHLAIGGYAGFLAATAGGQPPLPWLAKCLLTGAGGLRELRAELAEGDAAE